ncbi:Clavaminate synthase-like protein [Sistotremastrum niveocremeum HHB9708]|uniref:Clavaminate synthase-like protein n=1 Tax=Sistotremastrum niveocremeum HHB9708 TaxID=1314777 RepID=A0A164Z5Q0_9AGAM|nr:Clavaminate synthase-like protein [Sistotremastrum niveocremeum HHB9708]
MNGDHYKVLDRLPSALEFLRLVHISRPVLILESPVNELAQFSDESLLQRMGQNEISIAKTPSGRADAIVYSEGGEYFAEPCTEMTTMQAFLNELTSAADTDASEVLYLQSQDGNVYRAEDFNEDLDKSERPRDSELKLLRDIVPPQVPFVTEALDQPPDAVNLWIGDERSVTSIHADPYENVYTVVRGAKHFTLYPPTESCFMERRLYRRAEYQRPRPGAPLVLRPNENSDDKIPWPSLVDPDQVPPLESMPVRITVEAGQTLYLPAGWWHYVRQSNDHTGKCVAINWWYDMEMQGSRWLWLSFLKGELGDGEAFSEEDDSDTD